MLRIRVRFHFSSYYCVNNADNGNRKDTIV